MKRLGLSLLLLWVAPLVRAVTNLPPPEITLEPSVTFVSLKGNEQQFRHDRWLNDGWTGGGTLRLRQDLGSEQTLELTGRLIAHDGDYGAGLRWEKTEAAFVQAGWSEYRKYSETTGGYFSGFTPPAFQLAGQPQLRIGHLSLEAGLRRPNLPNVTVGYERQYKNGEKSLLEWGGVTQAGNTRKIYPALQNVDETTDIVRLEVQHEIKNIRLADQFRYEHYDADHTRITLDNGKTVTVREQYRHDTFFNTFHMDSQVNEKLYWSLGHLYTTLDGEGGVAVNTAPPLTLFDRNWVARPVDVEQDSHVLNANALFGPFKGLSVYAGLQAERTRGDGTTDALLATGFHPATTNRVRSSQEKVSLEETLGVRYTKIRFTTLYAEARLTQQQLDLDEWQTVNQAGDFLRQTDAEIFRQDYRVGFNTSPCRYVNLAGRYRHAIFENDYDHDVDTAPGYPAYITLQEFTTDEIMGKITLRPCRYFSAALQYQLQATAIESGTAGVPPFVPRGTRVSGEYDASIYSVSLTAQPHSRFYLTGLFSFQDTKTRAFDNLAVEVTAYRGNVYTLGGTAGFAWDEKTDLTAEYSYSRTDNFDDNPAGLALGTDYQRHGLAVGLTRKLNEQITVRLHYGWYQHNETSNGGLTDYTAHLFSTRCTVRF